MTKLSLAAKNLLWQDTALRALLGRSQSWETWIFADNPLNVHVEGNSRSLVVVSEGNPWTSMNTDNTMHFPTLLVDVWSDPTRNSDGSVRIDDARDKIETIASLLDKHFHRVHPSGAGGRAVIWGTATQITNRTGYRVHQSHRSGGIDYSPISDTDQAWMGRLTYRITTD